MDWKVATSWTLEGLLLALTVWFIVNRDALRDHGTGEGRTYSLSRVQLFWWTLIILGSNFALYGIHGEFWALNNTCLVLMGVSAVTTGAGKLVDSNRRKTTGRAAAGAGSSDGFIRDILSDENGPSVHRLQAVLFNAAYGIQFLLMTFTEPGRTAFPEFDAVTLAVLGVSSGTYVALKAVEGSASPSPTPGPAGSAEGDELLDPSPAHERPAG